MLNIYYINVKKYLGKLNKSLQKMKSSFDMSILNRTKQLRHDPTYPSFIGSREHTNIVLYISLILNINQCFENINSLTTKFSNDSTWLLNC